VNTMLLKNFAKKCCHALWPHTCVVCENPGNNDLDLCIHCAQALPHIQHACHRCGNPTETNVPMCGTCLKQRPPFYQTIAPYYYQDTIAHMITRLKFQHELVYARILGTLLSQYLKLDTKPNYIIPVPLHSERLKQRGFNQSLEIAKPIGKFLNIPVDINHCQRIKPTLSQSGLSAKNRQRNIKNAFHVASDFRANHVAILDDVITTGHTVAELANVLKKHGTQRIDVWSCARTSIKDLHDKQT